MAQELGISGVDEAKDETDDIINSLSGPEALCGGCLWDVNQDLEQVEYLSEASRSACELGFEKVQQCSAK